MFYQGDLQNGIATALQESKLVACFVTDEGEESRLWENDFLEDQTLKTSLSNDTILLRLISGSQEAAYLAAVFPLPKTPTVVIIQDGQLKEYLTAGISKGDFMRRMEVVFQSRVTSNGSGAASEEPQVQPAEQSPSVTQDMSPDRRKLIEIEEKESEAKEKAQRDAEANLREAALNQRTPVDSKHSADMKYALMQKKRQQDARDERARILKRVEDDKMERKREAQRKAQAQSKKNEILNASHSTIPTTSSKSAECALLVRLFDGSTIRSRFSSQGTLSADIRPWIDEQQTSDIPYTFKQVLTPFPNKNISVSDEERTLHSQGLAPSATLILVPVQDYTSAYEDRGVTGYVSKGITAGYSLVSSGIGLVTGVLGSFLGGGTQGQTMPPTESTSPSGNTSANVNVRTLRDQDRADDQQFYNGNALNFEPRKDDEKED